MEEIQILFSSKFLYLEKEALGKIKFLVLFSNIRNAIWTSYNQVRAEDQHEADLK